MREPIEVPLTMYVDGDRVVIGSATVHPDDDGMAVRATVLPRYQSTLGDPAAATFSVDMSGASPREVAAIPPGRVLLGRYPLAPYTRFADDVIIRTVTDPQTTGEGRETSPRPSPVGDDEPDTEPDTEPVTEPVEPAARHTRIRAYWTTGPGSKRQGPVSTPVQEPVDDADHHCATCTCATTECRENEWCKRTWRHRGPCSPTRDEEFTR
jgi:hypothetical protein